MRALRSVLLIAVVLVLFGTVMPVSAAQTRGQAPALKLDWRYQVPRPRPLEVISPEVDRFGPGVPVERVPMLRILVATLENALLGHSNPTW